MKHYSSIVEPLIYTAARLEAIANKYVFAKCGLSSTSVKILRTLSKHDSLTASGIIDVIGGTKSNISQRITVLERTLLIKRSSAQSKDKRTIAVRITPQGGRKLKEVDARLEKAKLSLEQNLTAKEIKDYLAFMEKINTTIDEGEKNISKIFCI